MDGLLYNHGFFFFFLKTLKALLERTNVNDDLGLEEFLGRLQITYASHQKNENADQKRKNVP